MENGEFEHNSKDNLKHFKGLHVQQRERGRRTAVYIARVPREAVSRWNPMAKNIFTILESLDQTRKEEEERGSTPEQLCQVCQQEVT
jgi:hypothetical protein